MKSSVSCRCALLALTCWIGLTWCSEVKATLVWVQEDPVAASPYAKDLPKVNPGAAFDGEFAMSVLQQTCELGPRISGSAEMARQQDLLTSHLKWCGAMVAKQRFQAAHPLHGRPVDLANLVARWHPDRKKRILIACHYDTRPMADRDPIDPQAVFAGANDGASGVGLLAELGRHLQGMDGKYGIDFVFFDAEELVYVAGRDPMFLGSIHFANEYAARRWDVKYEYGILVDMIGDKDLQIYFEQNSLEHAPRITKSIWAVAKELGVVEFIAKPKHQIRDDHLPLNTIARIPTCDIIDFDFPNETVGNTFWHTQQDIPENCSAESLGKVGRVLLEWLRQLQKI